MSSQSAIKGPTTEQEIERLKAARVRAVLINKEAPEDISELNEEIKKLEGQMTNTPD